MAFFFSCCRSGDRFVSLGLPLAPMHIYGFAEMVVWRLSTLPWAAGMMTLAAQWTAWCLTQAPVHPQPPSAHSLPER